MNSRTTSREMRILQRDNDRLRMELQFIKQELRDIHKDIALQKEARETQPPIVCDSKPLTRAEERPARARREPPSITERKRARGCRSPRRRESWKT